LGRIQTWQWRLPLGLSQRWLPLAAALPLFCLLVLDSFSIIETLSYQPATPRPTTQSMAQPGEVAGRIAAAEWFGVAPEQPESFSTLPETDLALTLRAVFVGEQQSSAIIENRDGIAQVIRAGSAIAPGITLTEVRSDRVVVTRNGRAEQLFFPSEPAATLSAPPATAAATPPAAASAPLTEEQKRASILRRLEALRARGAG
jgi:type II secretory pathway component PulC